MTEKSIKRKAKDLENYKKELKIMLKALPLIGYKELKSQDLADKTGLSVAKCGRFLSDMGYQSKIIRDSGQFYKIYYHCLSAHYRPDLEVL